MTNSEFDFRNIGKTTPYLIPDNFFEEMQNAVLAQTCKHHSKRRAVRIVVMAALAAAAVLAALIVLPLSPKSSESVCQQTVQKTTNEKVELKTDTPTDTQMAKTTPATVTSAVHHHQPVIPAAHQSSYTEESTNDEDGWIENLSDNDLDALTALAENDVFLN